MSNQNRPPGGPNTTSNIFANALASARKDPAKDVGAGMHNTIVCAHCGAARERDEQGPMVCRYCGAALSHASAAAARKGI
jgi:hypothetical protein